MHLSSCEDRICQGSKGCVSLLFVSPTCHPLMFLAIAGLTQTFHHKTLMKCLRMILEGADPPAFTHFQSNTLSGHKSFGCNSHVPGSVPGIMLVRQLCFNFPLHVHQPHSTSHPVFGMFFAAGLHWYGSSMEGVVCKESWTAWCWLLSF
jgi:hypothetical protein